MISNLLLTAIVIVMGLCSFMAMTNDTDPQWKINLGLIASFSMTAAVLFHIWSQP